VLPPPAASPAIKASRTGLCVDRFDVGHVADDVVFEQDAVPPSMSRASAQICLALRVLLSFARPAIVSVSSRIGLAEAPWDKDPHAD
jgi:hypothetical protein